MLFFQPQFQEKLHTNLKMRDRTSFPPVSQTTGGFCVMRRTSPIKYPNA